MAANASDIDKRFIRKLKTFAAHGYAFDAKGGLRKGTRKDPDSKGTQREAFDAYTKGFEEGHRQGYLEIPTGVGKTALFIALAKNYLEAVSDEKDSPRVLIVVPSVKLAMQTAQSIAKFLPKLAPTIETDDDSGKEIDWERSAIGLHYGKVKHADRKPRVLITTYQSLNRDREDKTYPPSEYGMVIYDEGHALTAAQYGEAVEKFKQSIQLAVSATPEYSEEKTIAARLPHRYYQLPLADAINRGDLCNVRPVLLKTDYTIDERKFRKFLEQNNGRPLNDTQMTALLNQQVRNKAAMEAYLQGADPDSGERYLGQNGMIFCGSTDHVDDFTRQLSDLLSKPKYRETRQWLNEERIELIAPVHGKIKGSWLRKGMLLDSHTAMPETEGRRYNGDKEWYSEEEIFDLHAKGQILLLASVKKLKEGYDSPRDSIIIDTVDRFSKVDATQIDGRGFRLNPKNDEHYDIGNPDKTCTVINMVDKNTHALYADDPQMLPIYCAEVIEGAEFRLPARRKGIVKNFSKEPPEIDKHLESADFKLITDIETVRGVSRENREKRNAAKPIEKPQGVWSGTELSERLNGGAGNYLLRTLSIQAKSDTPYVDYEGLKIPKTAFVTYGDRNQPNYGVLAEWGQKIADAYNKISSKGDNIMSPAELGKALGRDKGAGARIIGALVEQLEDKNKKHAEYKDLKIPRSALVQYRSTSITHGIEKECGQKIAAKYRSVSATDEEVWSSNDLAAAISSTTTTKVAATILADLRTQHSDPKNDHLFYGDVRISRDALVDYESNGKPALGIKQAWGEKIAVAYKKSKDVPEDTWTATQLSTALGKEGKTNGHVIIKLLVDKLITRKQPEATYQGIKIPKSALIRYGSDTDPKWGIKVAWGQKMVEANTTALPKPDHVLSGFELGEMLGLGKASGSAMVIRLHEKASIAKTEKVMLGSLVIPKTAFSTYFAHGVEALGIDRAWGKKIQEEYERNPGAKLIAKSIDEEDFKSKPITPRKSPAHMTEEERAEKKRGGKGLGD